VLCALATTGTSPAINTNTPRMGTPFAPRSVASITDALCAGGGYSRARCLSASERLRAANRAPPASHRFFAIA
jgi:hypothetical protein